MKLPLPAGLWPFIAEHRAAVPEALWTLAEKTMLNGSTHHGSRAFRAQRAAAVPSIHKGVHLLANHISRLTDPTREQFGGLKHRGTDLGDGRPLEVPARGALNTLPEGRLLRQQINHPPQALQLFHSPTALCCHLAGSQSTPT